ncbi:MAG: MBOAT family protein [Dongiaceae bacterium]
MLFNSWTFVLFFAVVLAGYRLADRLGGFRLQNRLLLVASYIFYAAWDWRFCGMLVAISVVDWSCGLAMGRVPERRRKYVLAVSIASDLGLLCYFKYANFLVANTGAVLRLLGHDPDWPTLHIILPVGISFIVFKSMSYTIDVYRGVIRPERHLLDYALFVAFFPDLVAGPIIRARTVLAQLGAPRRVGPEMLAEGVWLILLGYFLKIVVADNLSGMVNAIFAEPAPTSDAEALLGIYGFAFQILGDFSGYSSIAIGVARLLGFRLPPNFAHPYLVTSPRDFWRNWHISLSTWLRDYVYVSLGGNRGGTARTCRNLMITMLLGGLWHGAAWTFVLWGAFQGALLVLQRLAAPLWPARAPSAAGGPALRLLAILAMFHLTCFGWLIFRASSVPQIGRFLGALAVAPAPAPGSGWGRTARSSPCSPRPPCSPTGSCAGPTARSRRWRCRGPAAGRPRRRWPSASRPSAISA